MSSTGTLYVKLMTLSWSLSSRPDSASVGINGDLKLCNGGRRGIAPLFSSTNLRQIFVAFAPTLRRRRLLDVNVDVIGIDVDVEIDPVDKHLGGGWATNLYPEL